MQPELVKKRLFTSVISAPVALALLTVVLLWHLRVERLYADRFNQTEHVLHEAQSARSAVLAAHSAYQKYLISADPADLAAFKRTLESSGRSLMSLVSSSLHDPSDAKDLAATAAARQRWLEAM